MGLIGVPVAAFLYWLILRPKKEVPFPKWGIIRLIIAAIISVIVSSLVSMPISAVISFARAGLLSDFSKVIEAAKTNPGTIKEMLHITDPSMTSRAFWSIVTMFFSAGLLEEGLKCLTCRWAVRKEDMIHTWMECVISFAFVGITFELLENIAFSARESVLITILRVLSPAHFIFGVIMGYFYGKYRVTGQKLNLLLSILIPVVYHSIANGLMGVEDPNQLFVILGNFASLHFIATGILTVIIILHWQKNRTLDVPVKY